MNDKRSTLPRLTKYERAAILSSRVNEIVNGEPITVKVENIIDPTEIVKMEYAQNKIPKKIKRIWPNGEEEIWSLSELKKN